MTVLDHLQLLTDDAAAFADAIERGPADAPIEACPGWTLADLGRHLGGVQRWARAAILTGAVPQLDPAEDPPPATMVELAAWFRAGADRLLTTLREMDPARPTWHPFPVEPKLAGLWRRRQAQEASVHRWDAQHAIGRAATIEAGFAADGVDEYWTVMLPRLLLRTQQSTPSSRFAVRLTDTGHRFVADGATGLPAMLPTGVDAPVELTGTAQNVLLRLWGRPADVAVHGDESIAAAWLALGGA